MVRGGILTEVAFSVDVVPTCYALDVTDIWREFDFTSGKLSTPSPN